MSQEERKKYFCNVTFEVRKDFNEEMAKYAKGEEISKSELIRRAIKSYMNS